MKKALSLLLVLVLALGMSTMAFAAQLGTGNNAGITIAPSGANQSATTWTGDIDSTTGLNYYVQDLHPDDEIELTIDGAVLDAKISGVATSSVTKPVISSNKIKPRVKISKGSNMIDSYKIDYTSGGQAFIKIELINPWVSTGDFDFDFTVFLEIMGDRYETIGANISGTFLNHKLTENIDKDTDYVNLDGGRVVEADEYNAKVEYDLGNGVSIFGKAFKGKKYYGYSTTDLNEAQADIVDKYDIYEAYTIKQVGLAAISSYVTLDADKSMYVYDSNMKYLGRGNEELPFSDTYYLASKQLDVDDEEEPEDEDEDEDDDIAAPPVTGGDSDISSNVNDNPSTGK